MTLAASRWPAFFVTVVAVLALAFPIWYTAQVARGFGPFGTLIAWTCVCVSIFGILTIVASVWRSRLEPATPLEIPGEEGKV